MRRVEIICVLLIGIGMGCMAGGPAIEPYVPHEPTASASAGDAGSGLCPLILDRGDVALATTVIFHHLPQPDELQDAGEQPLIRHIVVLLPAWPQGNMQLPMFTNVPPEADVILIVPGYPPDRSSLEAWNYVKGPVRMILVVDGPPISSGVLDDLNLARHLERVVARMDQPSRAGFERLQRPLSFVHDVN